MRLLFRRRSNRTAEVCGSVGGGGAPMGGVLGGVYEGGRGWGLGWGRVWVAHHDERKSSISSVWVSLASL